MAAAAAQPPTRRPTPAAPRPLRWTFDEYDRMRETFRSWSLRTMLIDGEIIEVPMSDPLHDMGIVLAQYLFMAMFPAGHVVRVQLPLPLNINTDPEPDVAVVTGDLRTPGRDPRRAVLVLEAGNSSLDYDLGDKASLYAAAGIPDYWVADLQGGRVLVHRRPAADPAAKYGHRYADVATLTRGQALAPLARPDRPVLAEELLP